MTTEAEMRARWAAEEADPVYQARRAAEQQEYDVKARRRLDSAKVRFIEELRLPQRALDTVRDGLKPSLATAAIAANQKPILMLAGAAGAGGKTTGAVAETVRMVNDNANWDITEPWFPAWRGGRVLFTTARQVLHRWGRPFKNEELEILFGPTLLVLDDLGAEALDQKGLQLALIDELLDNRYSRRNCRTIVTTNLSAKTFQRRYGERAWDRLREVGAWVGMGTTSMRKAQP
jgi:DNA replication protein DnaC